MKTPITDAAADPGWQFSECAPDELVVPVDLARRLESDRAALMAAIERFLSPRDLLRNSTTLLDTTLAAARANFPEETP